MDIIHLNDEQEGSEYWPCGTPVVSNFMLDEAPL